MMARRGHGEGSIYQRESDGRWVGAVTLDTGKRKSFYGKTRKEVANKLQQALHEQKQGTLATEKSQRLDVYLNRWLDEVHKPTVEVSTYCNYRGILRNHLIPALGHMQVHKLTPQHVQAFYAAKLDDGLAASYIDLMHTVLHAALENAVKWNMVSRNVCDAVTKPRKKRYEIQPLTEEQARRFLEGVRGDVLEGIIAVTLALGLRRGEVLGLKWQDIDFEQKSLSIRRSVGRVWAMGVIEKGPKTESSKRKIMLPDFVVEAFQQQQVRQQARKASLGPAWKESGYVFPNTRGGFFHENRLHMLYKRALKRAGLPDIRFHDLRHSAATLMLSMGVHPKVVQEMLGHSNINMTLNVYGHVLPSMQQDATHKLDTFFRKDDS